MISRHLTCLTITTQCIAVAIFHSASAADYLLPSDQYGSVNLDLPQSLVQVQESNISGNGNYEPLRLSPPQDVLRRVARPVGRLDIRYEKGMSTCTAFVVADRQILTNFHCIPGVGKHGNVLEASLLMGFYSQTDVRSVKRYQVELKPSAFDRELDFSLLRVRGSLKAEWGLVSLKDRDPLPGESLLIVHHPLGLPLHVTRGRCRAASPTPVSETEIFHTCDTEGGSSGSPIMTADGTGVLGLHFSGVFGKSAFNRGKRLTAILNEHDAVQSLAQSGIDPSPPPFVNPVPPQPTNFSVNVTAGHDRDTVFLKSSFGSIREMDEAGCSSARQLAMQEARRQCEQQQGTLSDISYKSCSHTGRSVRRYEVDAAAVCNKGSN